METANFFDTLDKFGAEGGFKPGLQRMNKLLDYFQHPEKELPIIHVAGSNGKGSTIAFLKNIYRAAGYSVGTYISPPFQEFKERIMINDSMISDEELQRLISQIKPVVEKEDAFSKCGRPSFFEAVTLLAFLYFCHRQPDLVLLEVGLGGRLDATNVVEQPLLSVITEINREHTAILGATLSEIAREKAGIIKEGIPAVTGITSCKALKEIKKVAEQKKSNLAVIDDCFQFRKLKSFLGGQKILVESVRPLNVERRTLNLTLELPLPGKHQLRNALVALAAVEVLQPQFPVQQQHIRQGFCSPGWPGRFEIMSEAPQIILDGAHNPAAWKQLLAVFTEHRDCYDNLYIILSVLRDKDIESMGDIFAEFAAKNNMENELQVVITKNKNFRALYPREIAAVIGKYNLNYKITNDLRTALRLILENCSQKDLICVTGSFYTAAEARKILNE